MRIAEASPREHVSRAWTLFRTDDLVKNSFFLLAATATQGVLGAAFWLLCARFFTVAQIGVATALLSATVLLAYVSQLGLNSSIIRFLPNASDPDAEINNGMLLSFGAALVLGACYVAALPLLAGRLAFVRHSPFDAVAFVLFGAMTTLVLYKDAVFIARRNAKYNLFLDGFVQGGTKLALPVAFIGLGAFGMVAATGVAAGVDVLLSIVIMITVLGYRPRIRLHPQAIRQALGFSSANYFANLLNLLPTLVLPIAIIDELGARAAGFYYVAFSVANLLNAIAYSTSQALFAEGSHGDMDKRALMRKSARLLAVLTIPTAFLVAVVAPFVLKVFGKEYGTHATTTLAVLALGLLPVSACSWATTLLRVNGQLKALLASSVVYAVTICGLALWWAPSGLVYVAVAWVIGNIAGGAVAGAALWHRRDLLDVNPTPAAVFGT
jgi:O-antigen/teichoic acid export membrane protein